MPTSLIETELNFEDRLQLARKIVFDYNFTSQKYGELASWISSKSGLQISADQIKGYANKLKAAILKPQTCKDPGILLVCRRIGALN